MWLEGGMNHRMDAARPSPTQYYNQNPRLLRFVLSKPPDRVKYSDLRLARRTSSRSPTWPSKPAS